MSPLASAQAPVENGLLYEYLSTFCYDDYYYPMDGEYQNFTYFPKAGLNEVRAAWKKTVRLMGEGKAPRELGLYIHWPFCVSKCTFCFCSMKVPDSSAEREGYLASLKAEMDAFADIFKHSDFDTLWIGGGTPTFMSERGLEALFGHLRASFKFSGGAQIYVEASPSTLTKAKVEVLAGCGVNRLTAGVQSQDPAVLKRVDRRGQDKERTCAALAEAARRGMLVDMDLMLGLEGQTKASFVRDVAWALDNGPDALHVFAFDPKPQTAYFRLGRAAAGPVSREDLEHWMALADKMIRDAGYRTSRLDPKTLLPDCPEERQDSAVRRRGASVLGLGASAVSHAFGSAWYCHPLVEDGGIAASGAVPEFRLLPSDVSEEMRGCALRHLQLFGRLDYAGFKKLFGKTPDKCAGLVDALRALDASGHLRLSAREAVYAGRDPVERDIVLKSLYSPKLLKALMRGRETEFARYESERRGAAGPGRRPEAVTRKIEARRLFRVYFKGS